MLDAERRFKRAGLHFGHGTDNARDEAVFLVFHALELPFDVDDARLDAPLPAAAATRVESLVAERIATRRPAAYLTGRMWFAGHEFSVDEHVLIPRSPIGELIGECFEPWIDAARVQRVLDVGTGSGCIAIATALALPHCTVDATDVSEAALAVARDNARRLGVAARVHFHLADVFPLRLVRVATEPLQRYHVSGYARVLVDPLRRFALPGRAAARALGGVATLALTYSGWHRRLLGQTIYVCFEKTGGGA